MDTGFGSVGSAKLNLTSECLAGRAATVSVVFAGAGIGVGSPVTLTVSNVTLSGGNLMLVDPGDLVGPASLLSIGAAVGGGAALYEVKLGAVKSVGWGGQGGWDASASYIGGFSRASEDGAVWSKCEC